MESWKCKKCGREFEKKNQQHSCTPYALENHFAGKETAKKLYNKLKEKIEKNIGQVKVESLPCCIHFVAAYAPYTFAAVFALRDKIRIHFCSAEAIKSKRLCKSMKMPASKFMHSIDVKDAGEIDSELINWLKQAYELKRKK